MGKRSKKGRLKGKYKLLNLCVREGWTCWICKQSVPINAETGAPISPTRDHVVARSVLRKRNAPQTEWANNVKLAHKWCNEQKGNKRPMAPEMYQERLIEAQVAFEVKSE